MPPSIQRTGPMLSGLCSLEWLSHHVEGHSLWPNVMITLEVPASVSDDVVRRSVELAVARHETLRTTFVADPRDGPGQVVWTPPPVELLRPRRAGDDRESDDDFVARLPGPQFSVA